MGNLMFSGTGSIYYVLYLQIAHAGTAFLLCGAEDSDEFCSAPVFFQHPVLYNVCDA